MNKKDTSGGRELDFAALAVCAPELICFAMRYFRPFMCSFQKAITYDVAFPTFCAFSEQTSILQRSILENLQSSFTEFYLATRQSPPSTCSSKRATACHTTFSTFRLYSQKIDDLRYSVLDLLDIHLRRQYLAVRHARFFICTFETAVTCNVVFSNSCQLPLEYSILQYGILEFL